jgi:hypothetical protein
VFQHSNPYRADEVSDHFGKFAHLDNPESQEHQMLTLTRAYWPTSADAPAAVRESKSSAKMDIKAGYVVAHIEEWFPNESYTQYRLFLQNAAKEFLFRADGQADVRGRFWGTITDPPDVHELVVVIAPEELAKLKPNVDYAIVPQNGTANNVWTTQGRVSIARSANDQSQEVTLKGTILCARCALKESAKCQTAIQIQEGDKVITYYLDDRGDRETYHDPVCGGERKQGSVVGKAFDREGRKYVTPSKVEYAK